MLSWVKKFFETDSILPAILSRGIKNIAYIPEPTRSLIFVTGENPQKAVSPFSLTITISMTDSGIEQSTLRNENLYAEPSMIWKKLPVYTNSTLEEKPLYYPTYASLTPEQRYQYIMWLTDITKPTNLSYVFLYYYGLERHLLLGDFDKALEETLRLLTFHDKSSLRAYAEGALTAAILYKKRYELLLKYPFLKEGVSNEVLVLRRYLGIPLTANDIVRLCSRVGFTNRRYIKTHPELFLVELQKLLASFESENGLILESVPWEDVKISDESFFANASLPDSVKHIPTPQLLSNPRFIALLHELLLKTHTATKVRVAKLRKEYPTKLLAKP